MIAFTEAFTLTFRQQIGEFALANRLPMVAKLGSSPSWAGLRAMAPAGRTCGSVAIRLQGLSSCYAA